jgi:hypothetical protein
MAINRRQLLEARSQAKAVLASDLPEAARAAAKKVLDHANMALGLDDAIMRKLERTAPIEALRKKLANARQEVANLTVMGMRDNWTPKQRAKVHAMERAAREEAKVRREALEQALAQSSDQRTK